MPRRCRSPPQVSTASSAGSGSCSSPNAQGALGKCGACCGERPRDHLGPGTAADTPLSSQHALSHAPPAATAEGRTAVDLSSATRTSSCIVSLRGGFGRVEIRECTLISEFSDAAACWQAFLDLAGGSPKPVAPAARETGGTCGRPPDELAPYRCHGLSHDQHRAGGDRRAGIIRRPAIDRRRACPSIHERPVREDGAFRRQRADRQQHLAQFELPSGKRSRSRPPTCCSALPRRPHDLLDRAEAKAAAIEAEFSGKSAARRSSASGPRRQYHGQRLTPCGRRPSCCACTRRQCISIAGTTRFRKAPPEYSSRAGRARRSGTGGRHRTHGRQLAAGRLPEFAPMLSQLIYKPDRNRPEPRRWKSACADSGRVRRDCSSIAGADVDHDYRLGRFLFRVLPGHVAVQVSRRCRARPTKEGPSTIAAGTAAYLQHRRRPYHRDRRRVFFAWRSPAAAGHIRHPHAAPGSASGPDSTSVASPRRRCPPVHAGSQDHHAAGTVVDRFTLAAGRTVPACRNCRRRRRPPARQRDPYGVRAGGRQPAPPRHRAAVQRNDAGRGSVERIPWGDELRHLWEFAQVLEAGRGQPADNATRRTTPSSSSTGRPAVASRASRVGCIAIEERPQGQPAARHPGRRTDDRQRHLGRDAARRRHPWRCTACKDRRQGAHELRRGGHEGLGVDCYAWSSSPLRRYCDLLNQWQLLACCARSTPLPAKSADLLAACATSS